MKYGEQAVKDYSDIKNWELWDAPKEEEAIYQTFGEFTCLCPRSGYPDYATIHIVSVPGKKVLELKILKLWLNSFRNVGISHENACQTIFDTLWTALKPKALFVAMEYTPRGNLHTFPTKHKVKDIEYETGLIVDSMIETILKKMI